jgi:hypothetical protein
MNRVTEVIFAKREAAQDETVRTGKLRLYLPRERLPRMK